MNRFAEVLACFSVIPGNLDLASCTAVGVPASQCGTWGYGEIQKVVLLTISSCSTYVECLEMTYGNMMAGAGLYDGGKVGGWLGGLFGAWAGNVE